MPLEKSWTPHGAGTSAEQHNEKPEQAILARLNV